MKGKVLIAPVGFAVLLAGGAALAALTPIEELGKAIFFDETLSINENQSCASCHAPEAGWTGPTAAINAHGAVYEGSIPGSFGNRKPPSAAYATQSPVFHGVTSKNKPILFVGGSFWDGRATGERLGTPAADQAQGPFLNPLEQALAAPADVVGRVCSSSYAELFVSVWGLQACDPANVAEAFDDVALSIAAYEASPEVNAFTSKYDYFLAGKVELTKAERFGLQLFRSKGKCSRCHVLDQPALLTDFTYDNLGVPRNPENPFYAEPAWNPEGFTWIDLGLGGFLASRPDYAAYAPESDGKHKVPTLRNVDRWDAIPGPRAKAYGHNGYFKSLEGIVHFYNTRDAKPTCLDPFTTEADALGQGCWPVPEVPVNVNRSELGDLKLTPAQEAAIVAFLKTLTDGYELP